MRTVRAALVETKNAFADMPASMSQLPALAGRLDEIRQKNVDHNLHLTDLACDQGAQIICYSELFTAPYFALSHDPMWLGLAESIDGKTISSVRQKAREKNMVIIAPIYELDGDTRYNTAVVVDADGDVLGRFRKVHIPHGENEENEFCERHYYDASNGPHNAKSISPHRYYPVFETRVGKVGVAICYDRHFDGVMKTLRDGGAEMIFCPAVTFGATSQYMWEREFDVDALRNRVFIGGSNRCGKEAPWNQEFFGASHFTSPGGRLENLSKHSEIIIADLALHSLKAADPSGWQLISHRRPDTFCD